MEEFLSTRARSIDASGIRKVFDLASRISDPVNLSIGQPHFDVPKALKSAAAQAVRSGRNSYTPTAGIPELRAAVSQHVKRTRAVDAPEVMITSGTSGGLALALLATVGPGDEVLVPDPFFVSYKHLTTLAGATPVFFDTYPDFRIRREEIEQKVTEHTKVIIINSPANPTGVVLSEEELAVVADIARRHDLLVISDEVYDQYLYEGTMTSIATSYEKTLLVAGWSKSQAMTGWRIGYAAGPKVLVEGMIRLQQFTYVCAPSPVQAAALEALRSPDSCRPPIAEYRAKRDLLCNGLSGAYDFVVPHGAFYLFPKVPWGDGASFVRKAIESKLLVIPGNVFSTRDTHFRISFAAEDETIERGIEILKSLA